MIFLALRIRKIGSFIASIFNICVKFLNKFMIVLLVLPSTSTIVLLLVLNGFWAKYNNLVAFNSKISNIAILLKF